MKFNASTDPALSGVSLTTDQALAAANLYESVALDSAYLACCEIIALRAALEQHAEALRAAKLAGWEAGRRAAADYAMGSHRLRTYFVAVAVSDGILAIPTPTPSQLDEIR